MEPKPRRERKTTLRGSSEAIPGLQQRAGGSAKRAASKCSDTDTLPNFIAGKEVLGREVTVFKLHRKDSVWLLGQLKEFDEPTIRHKVEYQQPLPPVLQESNVQPVEWLSLAKHQFLWKDPNHVNAFANPTYSKRFTPQRESAVNHRVKVFWTAMSRWYQGKVISYDAGTGRHRVKFRDGDEREMVMAQEPCVWMDIPELSCTRAIKKTRAEEGNVPVAIIREGENKPPAQSGKKAGVDGAKSLENGHVKAKNPKQKVAEVVNGLQKKVGKQAGAKTNGKAETNPKNGKTAEQDVAAKQKPVVKRKASAVKESKQPSPDAKKQSTEEVKSASSSSVAPKQPSSAAASPSQGPGGTTVPQNSAKTASLVASASGQPAKNSETPKPAAKQPQKILPKKRGRAALQEAPSPEAGEQPDAKRRLVTASTAKAPLKVVRRTKPAEESRLGRKQKSEQDIMFEESCQAVMGARISVWWEDDKCYYKGKVVGFDGYRKKLKVHYDDGIEEHIHPQKPETRFRWLLPRAQTAGASDQLHAAFQALNAENAGNPVMSPGERSSAAVPVKLEITPKERGAAARPAPVVNGAFAKGVPRSQASGLPVQLNGHTNGQVHPPSPGQVVIQPNGQVTYQPGPLAAQQAAQAGTAHKADGRHLDALVPLKQSGPMAGTKLTDAAQSKVLADLAKSVAQKGAEEAGTRVAVSACPSPHLQMTFSLPQTSTSTGLSAMVPHAPGMPALFHIDGASKPGTGAPIMGIIPHAHYQANLQPHLKLSHSPSPCSSPPVHLKSLPRLGQPVIKPVVPQGNAAEGWKVSIAFRGNGKQYMGKILAFDAKSSRCQVLWEDGEDEWIDANREQLVWHSDRNKTSGFAAGLPEGQHVPKGEELVGWKIAVYWKEEQQFYEGIIESYDPEIDQHTISYNDGDQLCESLCGLTFKYVLPPTVQTVESRRPTRKYVELSDYEDSPPPERRSRRRQRGSPDEESEDDWGKANVIEHRVLVKQASVAPRDTKECMGLGRMTSGYVTPGDLHRNSSMYRIPSGKGALMVFDGEDSPASPAGSPYTPQNSFALPTVNSCKRQPLFVRPINQLRNAQGFTVGLRKVRVFLSDSASEAKASLPEAQQLDPKAKDAEKMSVPAKLKLMLERVEQAQENIRNGMPLESADSDYPRLATEASIPAHNQAQNQQPAETQDTGSPPPAAQPAPRNSLVKLELEQDELEEPLDTTVLRVSQPQVSEHLKHLTPPPSPFSGVKEVMEAEACLDAAGETDREGECSEGAASGCPPQQTSMSSPQTPSKASEMLPQVVSRNGSMISAPMLREGMQADLHGTGDTHMQQEELKA